MSKITNSLNEAQIQAVTHLGTPLLVLAGAGSGKTKALTHRAAWLMEEQSITHGSILLLTFTNKAAGEMLNRMGSLIMHHDLPYAGTFHRFCALLLRRHGHLIGVPNTYVIYDDDDQRTIMKQLIKDRGLDTKRYKADTVLSAISFAKNELLTPQSLSEKSINIWQETVAHLYNDYQKILYNSEAVDFDDLMMKSVQLLKQEVDLKNKYNNQYEHILVDEYQDTNNAQYQLTKILAGEKQNLMVVGDFSQAIYSWRGADYKNLDQLGKDYPNLTVVKLEQNYRSTQTILAAASSLISYNTSHPVLELWTKGKDGNQINIYEAYDEQAEANFVAQTIRTGNKIEGKHLGDFVVMYRTNAQSRAIEEALLREGLPYVLIGGVRFYARKEIKDLLSYLRLTVNPNDSVSKERMNKMGKRRLWAFEQWREKNKDTYFNMPSLEVLDAIIEATGYVTQFDVDDKDDMGRLENIQELRSVAAKFVDLGDFLENVALVEQESTRDINQSSEKVTLMTLHAAKGLEFPIVFMVGMEEGLFPHSRSLSDPDQMEEERRLCYVGITRAREELYLTYANQRYFFGRRENFIPSRFLGEIPSELISKVKDTLLGESDNNSWGYKLAELDDLPFAGVKSLDDWF